MINYEKSQRDAVNVFYMGVLRFLYGSTHVKLVLEVYNCQQVKPHQCNQHLFQLQPSTQQTYNKTNNQLTNNHWHIITKIVNDLQSIFRNVLLESDH